MATRQIAADRIERLTEGQRVCLRLVNQHLTSKDIAREIGISPHTVDQRLRQAIELLGVQSRGEAARIFAQHEGGVYQPLIHQSPHIADTPHMAAPLPSDIGDRWHEEMMVREAQAPYLAFATSQPGSFIPPLPVRRGDTNELTKLQRLGWTFVITLGTALSAGVFLAGFESLGKIAWAWSKTLS